MTIGRFLAGVGALIREPGTNRYLLLRRSDQRDFESGRWECAAGRVEQGESFEEALHREVFEETGLKVEIDFIIGTTHFFRGQEAPENELLGVLFGCSTNSAEAVSIGDEHSEWRWVLNTEAYQLLGEDSWLAKAIQRSEYIRGILTDEMILGFHDQGFTF